MTDLDRPLSEQLLSESERRVLGSIRLDVPTSEGAQRSAAMLGLSPGAAEFGSSAAVGSQVATGAAVGGAVVIAALIGAFVLFDGEAPPARAPAPKPAPIAKVVASGSSSGEPRVSEPVAAVAPSEPADEAPARPLPSAAKPSLEDQLARMDRARAALGRGDGAAALSEVGRYQSAYPNGALLQEARVIRILSLDQLGRTSEARTEAKRFVSKYPNSPHAQRLERLTREPITVAPGGGAK